MKETQILTAEEWRAFDAGRESWIQQWIQDHPERCLATQQIPGGVTANRAPFILFCLWKCKAGQEMGLIAPLIQQAVTLGVALDSIVHNKANLLHWVVDVCSEKNGLPLLRRLLESGHPVYALDQSGSEARSAAALALQNGTPQIFELLLTYYDVEHLAQEREQWGKLIDDLGEASQREFGELVANREAQLLTQELPTLVSTPRVQVRL